MWGGFRAAHCFAVLCMWAQAGRGALPLPDPPASFTHPSDITSTWGALNGFVSWLHLSGSIIRSWTISSKHWLHLLPQHNDRVAHTVPTCCNEKTCSFNLSGELLLSLEIQWHSSAPGTSSKSLGGTATDHNSSWAQLNTEGDFCHWSTLSSG